MKIDFRSIRSCLSLVAAFILIVTAGPSLALANNLTGVSDSLSDHLTGNLSSHTVAFTTASSAIGVKRVSFRFSTTLNGSSKPTGLDLSSATLGSVSSSLGTGWSLHTDNAAIGELYMDVSSPYSLSAPVDASAVLDSITNNTSIDQCQVSSGNLSDSCYLHVALYSDNGNTLIDAGDTTYVVAEPPTMKFEILPVGIGTSTNGITTDGNSTESALSFGNISPDQVKYLAQDLKITTNAPHGYTVYAYLSSPISGSYTSTQVSPFGATNATWDTPQPWSIPTGVHAGSNTGWLGANITDARVTPGWSGTTTAKFGPVSVVRHVVAHSDSPDPSGTTVTVTYALGINGAQTADTYNGSIIYDVDVSY